MLTTSFVGFGEAVKVSKSDYWEMQEKIDKLERKIEEMKVSKKSSDNLIDLLNWI